MAKRTKGHTGKTNSGSTKQVKVDRIGKVTLFKRGKSYYLYYRDRKQSVRKKVEGNLNTARAQAARVASSLEDGRPTPLVTKSVAVAPFVREFLDYCEHVQALSVNTLDRYRAALEHFVAFTESRGIALDKVDLAAVEAFVKHLRTKQRVGNGGATGDRKGYSPSGIRFILCVCRTALNWAAKRRYVSAYEDNPFSTFPISKVFKVEREEQILSADEQQEFFEACDEWQCNLFLTLSVYGLRVGELTHLLVSDADLDAGILSIRSKPELFWTVKTQRKRTLPIPPELTGLFKKLVAGRAGGCLFLAKKFYYGEKEPRESFASQQAFRLRLEGIVEEAKASGATTEKELRRAVVPFLREMGQIPQTRVRQEFMKITKKIGVPELTKPHSLRHLFSTRAQEQGLNPLMVQGLLGHTTLGMTSRYTHFGIDAQRESVSAMVQADAVIKRFLPGSG